MKKLIILLLILTIGGLYADNELYTSISLDAPAKGIKGSSDKLDPSYTLGASYLFDMNFIKVGPYINYSLDRAFSNANTPERGSLDFLSYGIKLKKSITDKFYLFGGVGYNMIGRGEDGAYKSNAHKRTRDIHAYHATLSLSNFSDIEIAEIDRTMQNQFPGKTYSFSKEIQIHNLSEDIISEQLSADRAAIEAAEAKLEHREHYVAIITTLTVQQTLQLGKYLDENNINGAVSNADLIHILGNDVGEKELSEVQTQVVKVEYQQVKDLHEAQEVLHNHLSQNSADFQNKLSDAGLTDYYNNHHTSWADILAASEDHLVANYSTNVNKKNTQKLSGHLGLGYNLKERLNLELQYVFNHMKVKSDVSYRINDIQYASSSSTYRIFYSRVSLGVSLKF